MHIKPFIILALLIVCLSTNAQTALKNRSYIVTKTNDTVYGRIKANWLVGGLKLVTADSVYKIDANTYTAYYNAKKKTVYRSRVLPGFISAELAKKMSMPENATWLKCIEDGEIALYEHKSSTFGYSLDNALGITTTFGSIIGTGGIPNSEFTNWYVEKGGSPLTPIKYNSFVSAGSKAKKERKQLLKEMLADNDGVSKSYDQNKPFTFKLVQTLIHEYNRSKS
ncbi:hypothetical protein [Mucilaginibacter sp. FT3.2]|uniref:hypothetical protein n=1 Tax=Mucilaginibacter sp. FT3.2 TaxID=2723090 RepID=UPI0016168B60|nr:hypothetical protein [Mucilaginibacter sp. FT3.2]MBB6231166.1 hypothetical protein [Mucilaginibacter sp. FT3.2]